MRLNKPTARGIKTYWLICLLIAGSLTGCASVDHLPAENTLVTPQQRPTPSFESDLFGEAPDIIAVDDIYLLSDTQQKDFLAYFGDPSRLHIPEHQRVFDYLEAITMNFGYQGETYAAQEALSSSSGNCLSLAILTTALARLAGVETGYQLINSAPVFEYEGSVIFRGQHVRTKLLTPLPADVEASSIFRRGGLLVDYFPSDMDRFISNVSKAQYQAMYYNNLASEAIAKQDYNEAYWLLRKAIELSPDSAGAINSMAILYRRVGNPDKSEQIYQYAIKHLSGKASLLRNYRGLLIEQQRFEEAEAINTALAELDDPNPFDWLQAAQDAYNSGDFNDAISFNKKAIEIAPYLHESYAGMAKAHYMLGDTVSARRELTKARELSYQKSAQSLYQAKLMALAAEH